MREQRPCVCQRLIATQDPGSGAKTHFKGQAVECKLPSSILLSVSIQEHRGKSERQGRKSGDNSGQAANCRMGIGFSAAENLPIRSQPRVPRLPLEIAPLLGHPSAARVPGRHREGLPATLGIIAENGETGRRPNCGNGGDHLGMPFPGMVLCESIDSGTSGRSISRVWSHERSQTK